MVVAALTVGYHNREMIGRPFSRLVSNCDESLNLLARAASMWLKKTRVRDFIVDGQ